MEMDRKVKVLQGMYAGATADFVLRLGKEGLLEKVTEEKRVEQMKMGKDQAVRLGIADPREVFTVLADIFGCANWTITGKEDGFSAEATVCMLCAMAKRMGAQSPCRMYCLNPMEGMVKGLEANAEFIVNGTLWEGEKCHVDVVVK